jgi:GNAT superfamily N-acetyltransferase
MNTDFCREEGEREYGRMPVEGYQVSPGEWDSYWSIVKQDKEFKHVTERWSSLHAMDPNYASNLYILFTDNRAASFNATYFSRGKKKNGWGRYVNWHLAYTLPEFRRQGFARKLARAVELEARKAGYHRLKSLCQTQLGYFLHRSLGHQCWGPFVKAIGQRAAGGEKSRGALVVDTPLRTDWQFPEGIPIEARCALDPHLMTKEECENLYSNL